MTFLPFEFKHIRRDYSKVSINEKARLLPNFFLLLIFVFPFTMSQVAPGHGEVPTTTADPMISTFESM
ncbi:MAG: hypothetical protein UY82_C0048G0006 [Candidatus Uhrbacteria bacterium GW2011_GWC2_53_7]|uniref:Uncharacterized protein n=1 Tax=Candidatus Uhrbacteria bacterium GW2011_GWC2_53_7 TaxID=1618986 RepID=A0A0G1XW18_9BACT|nr:MAG: hypothetical protein UY82_C0048G0006 [Candidatus Uhrbacteria bacterium GW2011_GWC2_53_7]